MLQLRILGGLEVDVDGRPVELRRPKLRAVLAVLALRPNRVVSIDELADALWGDRPPASVASTLYSYVSHLRRALDRAEAEPGQASAIRTHPAGYLLAVEPDHIDALRFERMAAVGRRQLAVPDVAAAAETFRAALSLWRGRALAEFAYCDFASVEAKRLEELRLTALEEWTEAELALGHHDQVVGRLQGLVEEQPLRERLWAQLILALYRGGRQGEALRACHGARRRLADELGIEPGPVLKQLEADVLAQSPGLTWGSQSLVGHASGGRSSAATTIPLPGLLSGGASIHYVGREKLLSRLDEARRQAATGTPRAVLLAGEPGVGKTRTATEVAKAAHAEGAVVLYGRCDGEVALPYQPFVEALDWYAAHAAQPVLGHYPGELTRLHPLLTAQVAGLPAPVSSDPRSEEHLLFEATASWLLDLARGESVVLIVDDLHWATKPVVLLLRHLLRAAASAGEGPRLLVLATYRDTEVTRSHPLVISDLRRLPLVDQHVVTGLSVDEVDTFVRRAMSRAGDHEPRRLAEMVHAETEGNPFFVSEVLRHLVEGGTFRPAGDGGPAADHGGMSVPDGVRDVVGRRLSRLSPSTEELLRRAAVLGRDFDVEVLADVTDLSEGALLDALDEAVGSRLVEETGPDRYRFAHALVRATLLEQLSATRRRRLHQRAADALERARPDDVVGLAHHFAEAGCGGAAADRAVRYGLAAAERALAARALADAEGRFRHVLAMLDGRPGRAAPERVHALCGLGEAQRDQGDPGFRSTLLEAGRLAQVVGDVGLLVRATLSNFRGVPSVIGGVDAERVALTEAALEAIGPDPSPDRARLLAQLAAEISFTHCDQRRLLVADEAEALARTLGDDSLLGWVLNRTGYAAFSPRRVERLMARGEEATRLADASGDPSQRVLSRYFWSGALLTAGQLTRFRAVTQEMLEVSQQAAPTLQWLARVTQARLCGLEGDSPGLHRINDDALGLAQELGEPDGAAWWAATLAPHSWHQGSMGRMAEVLKAGVEQYPGEDAWRIGYALALALLGDRNDEAREVLGRGMRDLDELLDHVFPFFNAVMLGPIAFHLGDADLAARTAQALRPYRRFWAHQYAGTIGRTSFYEALCLATAGDLDEAVALFEETERELVAFGCGGLLPLVRTYYAEILRRRGSAADRELADHLLAEVRRQASDLDAPDLLGRAEALACSSPTSPS